MNLKQMRRFLSKLSFPHAPLPRIGMPRWHMNDRGITDSTQSIFRRRRLSNDFRGLSRCSTEAGSAIRHGAALQQHQRPPRRFPQVAHAQPQQPVSVVAPDALPSQPIWLGIVVIYYLILNSTSRQPTKASGRRRMPCQQNISQDQSRQHCHRWIC